jgi:hypothetical protein
MDPNDGSIEEKLVSFLNKLLNQTLITKLIEFAFYRNKTKTFRYLKDSN